jgi:predicted phosphate transport protein (TIGR00153 family)
MRQRHSVTLSKAGRFVLAPGDMRLFPREEKFYEFFLTQAKIILDASRLLLEGAQAGNSSLASAAAKIKTMEQRGDEVIHEIYTRLNQTFITPLDPEDIHSLSSHLDDVLDGVEDAAYRMVAYRVEPIPHMVVEVCKIVYSCAQALEGAFQALSANKPVLPYCIEVNRLEEVADQLVRDAVSELFRSETDPITLLKLKEIYEFLEQTTDNCEDVADALQNVAVKHS